MACFRTSSLSKSLSFPLTQAFRTASPHYLHSCKRSLQAATTLEPRFAYLERLSGSSSDAGITFLNLDRHLKKNAISTRMLEEIEEAVEDVRFDQTTRVLILRSPCAPPDSTFSAGADLKERLTMAPVDVSRFLHHFRRAISALEDLPMVTIAAIDQGGALGGGLELALGCDLRVAAHSNVSLGLPETKLAIIPGAGGTQRLSRLVGLSRAKSMIFTGRIISSEEALNIGLIDYLAAPRQSASDRAVEVAKTILPNGPIALQMAKKAVDSSMQLDLESGLDFERQCYDSCLSSQDRIEGLTAFREKRTPVYKGI